MAEMVPLVIGGLFATASVGIFVPKVQAQYIFGNLMFPFFFGNLFDELSHQLKSLLDFYLSSPPPCRLRAGPLLCIVWNAHHHRGFARGARCGRVICLNGGVTLDCRWPRYCRHRRGARQ